MTQQPIAPADAPAGDAYQRLISMLDTTGARYRVVDHIPEGRTEIVSTYRGHPVACAAKCLIVMVKTSKRTSRYYLAVVPGDARVDLQALKTLASGTYAAVAVVPQRSAVLMIERADVVATGN